MENNLIINFLTSFFALFKADILEYRLENNKVTGTIGWDVEEEKQLFSWIIPYNEQDLYKLKLICDFLLNNKLVEIDRIIISQVDLKKLLINNGWDLNDTDKYIEHLLSIKINMIDDGEATDYFFIHL